MIDQLDALSGEKTNTARRHFMENRMSLNAPNRWKQMIAVSIDQQYSAKAARLFGTPAISTQGRHNFIWARFTSHRGDDERVVWDLSTLLNDLPEDAWYIDWKNSRY
ncbi:hypothetical protein [Agrobacterium sp. CCNWLW32]|uniref:hypothetical protein n=1 Tax=Agrobacterium sp. CCNWLW32 TaxID=3122072 RepID=UPI0030102BF9